MSGVTETVGAKINLLIVISNLGHGGAERQVVEICNRLNRSQFNVHLCILSEHMPLADRIADDVPIHCIVKRWRLDITVVWRLIQLMGKLDIDVVHSFLLDAEIAARIAGRLVGKTVVIGSERNTKHNYNRLMYLALKLTSGLPHIVVANSRAGKDYHQSTFKLDDDKYKVVYNGVDTCHFKPAASAIARTEFELCESCFVIGMIGSFKKQKNHPYLLDVIERLKEHRQDFCVLLVGAEVHEGDLESSAYCEHVLSEIKSRGLSKYFRMVGARQDINDIYRLCDVTVLPSLFEGTPNVALESLASGVPVIATDVSDNATVIPDGKVGFIVPLGTPEIYCERINNILTDQWQRSEMSKRAREWAVTQFSREEMITNMSNVYLSAIASKSRVDG